MSPTWPYFENEAHRFVSDHMRRPRALFDDVAKQDVPGSGSGRPAGQRALLWQSVVVLSVAGLEAGLEDLLFAAYARSLGVEGGSIAATSKAADVRRTVLVGDPLQAPNARKVERLLLGQFGLSVTSVPLSAHHDVMAKDESNRGSGKGTARGGPTTWKDLKEHWEALSYVRNAVAHADTVKLKDKRPKHAEGVLWVASADGTWSVQKPHALSAMRTVTAIFNTVAEAVAASVGHTFATDLDTPMAIDYPSV